MSSPRVDEDISDITDGGGITTSDCSLSSSSEVAQEQRNDPSLSGCWKLADKGRAGFLVQDNLLYHHISPDLRQSANNKAGCLGHIFKYSRVMSCVFFLFFLIFCVFLVGAIMWVYVCIQLYGSCCHYGVIKHDDDDKDFGTRCLPTCGA